MDADLRAAILTYTRQPAYKPAKPKVIAERLGLIDAEQITAVKRVIKRMVKAGELEFGPNHLVLPTEDDHPSRENLVPKKKKKQTKSDNHVTGTFRRVSSGDGFVRPEGTPASTGRDGDIRIAKKAALDAASGDKVRIKVDKRGGYKGKPEGRVLDVVERATSRFVGVYVENADMGLVEVDGKIFSAPIYVGDPGAKGVKPDDKVVIDMVRFPSHVRDGEGVIVQVLGGKGDPGVDTMSIIYEFGLPGEFQDEVLDDARKQADAFDESIPKDRRDLTGEVIITIDPATARDFDDAISLRRIESKHGDEDHWLLGVHIADVSHFVPEKTTLDAEAYDRATSVYLPDRVLPMLPEIISNNLASLQPKKVRYAMTCEIEMTAEGMPVAVDVFKSAIKSRRRFTYEQVDDYLANRTAWKKKLTKGVHQLLADMHELAMLLRGRRFDAGALELSMPEVEIDLDDNGKMCGAHVEESTESHQIIEEFMLAANVAVATKLADAGLIFLRRVHGDPDTRKLKALTEFVRELGFKTQSLESRFELQRLLDMVKNDARQHAVNYAVLRSMQRAVYSPEDEGHYALAADCYCHFTSPIRRYPDLIVHRLINALNSGMKPRQELDRYFQWGDHCSEREQRATAAERELTKVKLLHYMADKVGTEMEGIITGVERFGLFVTGKEIPAEGFVHISALGDDYYKFDRASHSIAGFQAGQTFRLGDAVRVAVA
ncbi:MAG: ribonuclease R, partial [Aeoliella sp.]